MDKITSLSDLRYFQLQTDSNQVTTLFWHPHVSKKVFSFEVLEELSKILSYLETAPTPCTALIIRLDEVLGADIHSFEQLEESQISDYLAKGHDCFAQLEQLPFRTLAVIEGVYAGGGFELALSCQSIIASDNAKVRIGLPEVKLGIIPGWGGTVRLVRRIGALKALPFIFKGELVSAFAAKKIGVIDEIIPDRHLERAIHLLLSTPPKPLKRNRLNPFINLAWIRPLVAYYLESQLKKRIHAEHYPQFYTLIHNWKEYGITVPKAFLKEQASVLHLITHGNHVKNLIRVFKLQELLKSMGKKTHAHFEHVHVVGAGTMGRDIAAWCAYQGFTVTLQDQDKKALAKAVKTGHALLLQKLKDPNKAHLALDRLIPDPHGYGLTQADVIIEAIYEDLNAKQMLFKQIEAQAKKSAVLASNTSSLPLTEIAKVLKDKQRLVGIHFFNPVAKMPLVEVVKEDHTDPLIFEQALNFVKQIHRLPLPVKSKPGFLVNRILMPYLLEAMKLRQEGHSLFAIDKAAKEFGMPMGPLELADAVGLDICYNVAQILSSHGGSTFDPIPELTRLIQAGHLGKKTGQGFYLYHNNKPIQTAESIEHTKLLMIQNRLIASMTHESMRVLEEKIVDSPDLLDAGMIFGTGFPPFRGGITVYSKENTHSSGFLGEAHTE